jgi:hypothetical protein
VSWPINLFLVLICFPRDPHPVADPNGYVFAVLAGMPSDPTYSATTTTVFKKFKAAGEVEAFGTQESTHRRGQFSALPFGISCGNGQVVPGRLRTGGHGGLVEMLRGSSDLQRVANFADGEFGTW